MLMHMLLLCYRCASQFGRVDEMVVGQRMYCRYGKSSRTFSFWSLVRAAQPRSLRLTPGDIHSLICRLPAWRRKILPVPVILNRRAAALFVFILGMRNSGKLNWAVNTKHRKLIDAQPTVAYRGESIMITLFPSILGSLSIMATSFSSLAKRFINVIAMSLCCISRPRRIVRTLILSPSVRNF